MPLWLYNQSLNTNRNLFAAIFWRQRSTSSEFMIFQNETVMLYSWLIIIKASVSRNDTDNPILLTRLSLHRTTPLIMDELIHLNSWKQIQSIVGSAVLDSALVTSHSLRIQNVRSMQNARAQPGEMFYDSQVSHWSHKMRCKMLKFIRIPLCDSEYFVGSQFTF